MGRYSKTYSNYILKKRHQDVNDGSIFERDWGTLGERHVIEPGKKRVYGDSNFLFTDNAEPGSRYRNNTGPWSDPYTQDSLGYKVDSTVNDTSLLTESNDIRDYAYYGSATELIRVSIENIIKWFPGKFWSTNAHVSKGIDDRYWVYIKRIINDGHHNYVIEYTDDESECQIYMVKNPFTIDFYNVNIVINDQTNVLRNMPLSYKQYETNSGKVLSWDVWAKPGSECDNNYTIKYEITFKYDDGGVTKIGTLYGIVIDRNVVWCTDVQNLEVQPSPMVIDNYFSQLTGFEAKLLDRRTNPQYTVKLITPIEYKNNNPNYLYVERSYGWPHDGYCISVDTVSFENYVNSLYTMAHIMDELWCDNIWRSMTHEAIQNFDWTYTRNYEEGQEEENILGGTRMEGILRIWGRCYDDIKRYIDGISLKNCVTYNAGAPNLGNAELSDKAELLGWEIYSTKLNKDDNMTLDQPFITTYLDKWYDTKNPELLTQNDVDNDFMKRLVLSSGEIFRTKGTKHAIEMVFGMFGIGNNNQLPVYRYQSANIPQSPLSMDDLIECSSYERVDTQLFEYYLPRMKNTTIIVAPIHSTVTLRFKYNDTETIITECDTDNCLIDISYSGLISDLRGDYKALMYYAEDVKGVKTLVSVKTNTQPDFELFERYYSIEPRKCDDMFYYYKLNETITPEHSDLSVYVESPYATFDEYLVALRANPHMLDPEYQPEPHIIIDDEFYDLVTDTTVAEFCQYIQKVKTLKKLYSNDSFSGTPLREVYMRYKLGDNFVNERCMVPYFTQNQLYDGNVYFESKGGWGKTVEGDYDFNVVKTQEFDYLETIPYMEIIQNITSLVQVNKYQIGQKRIFYVVDLSDLSDFIETIPTNISHFFKLHNPQQPNDFASWKNIPSDGYIDPNYRIFDYITEDDIKLAQYNDKLALDNLGNNPHCGYAEYDMGTEYYEYLQTPYKYAAEEYGFKFEFDSRAAAQLVFGVEEINEEKIKNLVEDTTFRYIMPSKLLIIRNNIKNSQYKKYLAEIIMKYVLQIIPSTTILMLENKEYKSYYYTTQDIPTDPFEMDIFTEFSGDILTPDIMSDTTFIVVENTANVRLRFTSGGIESVITECYQSPCLVDITNKGLVVDIPDGYKVLLYYFNGIQVDNESVKISIE